MIAFGEKDLSIISSNVFFWCKFIHVWNGGDRALEQSKRQDKAFVLCVLFSLAVSFFPASAPHVEVRYCPIVP